MKRNLQWRCWSVVCRGSLSVQGPRTCVQGFVCVPLLLFFYHTMSAETTTFLCHVPAEKRNLLEIERFASAERVADLQRASALKKSGQTQMWHCEVRFCRMCLLSTEKGPLMNYWTVRSVTPERRSISSDCKSTSLCTSFVADFECPRGLGDFDLGGSWVLLKRRARRGTCESRTGRASRAGAPPPPPSPPPPPDSTKIASFLFRLQ